MFLDALALDLEKTQRAIPSSCLFCVPQPRSLVADQELSADDLYTHFLTPAGTATDAHARHPGEYDTLNGVCCLYTYIYCVLLARVLMRVLSCVWLYGRQDGVDPGLAHPHGSRV